MAATEKRSSEAASAADREIVATRVIDAPRAMVWKVWTEPDHVKNWWGPDGFTNTSERMEVRPGGVLKVVMHGPDGIDYQNKIVYDEIVKPERIVYTHTGGAQFQSTITFEDLGKKTRITVSMVFETASERERVVKKFGAVEGLSQTLGRLNAYVAAIQ